MSKKFFIDGKAAAQLSGTPFSFWKNFKKVQDFLQLATKA